MKMEMGKNMFLDDPTSAAFNWLTKQDSLQLQMLENAMRNYSDPVYDPHLISKHLMKALGSDIFGYKGNTSEVKYTMLAITVVRYTRLCGWDIVVEKTVV